VRRFVAHCAFGAVALVCGVATSYQAWHLVQSHRVNAIVADAQAERSDADFPQARFARALALAQSGKTEDALKLYKSLALDSAPELRLAALFNTGNLYMRDARRYGPDEAFKSVPLVELAKQAYRDLLSRHAEDWDARYNLERALWMVPEVEQGGGDDSDVQSKEQRVTSNIRGEPVDLP